MKKKASWGGSSGAGAQTLARIRRRIPGVKYLQDATKPIRVKVNKDDVVGATKNDALECVMARACVREKVADAELIGMSTSYLINGDTATRYMTSSSLARELTSFDRNGDFEPTSDWAGVGYLLSPPSHSSRIGASHGKKMGSRKQTGKKKILAHVKTARTRTL